jgi:hypothetical protein
MGSAANGGRSRPLTLVAASGAASPGPVVSRTPAGDASIGGGRLRTERLGAGPGLAACASSDGSGIAILTASRFSPENPIGSHGPVYRRVGLERIRRGRSPCGRGRRAANDRHRARGGGVSLGSVRAAHRPFPHASVVPKFIPASSAARRPALVLLPGVGGIPAPVVVRQLARCRPAGDWDTSPSPWSTCGPVTSPIWKSISIAIRGLPSDWRCPHPFRRWCFPLRVCP